MVQGVENYTADETISFNEAVSGTTVTCIASYESFQLEYSATSSSFTPIH